MSLVQRFNAMPKKQQMLVGIGLPVAVALALLWFTNKSLVELGPDEALPGFMRKSGGLWGDIATKREDIAKQEAIIAERPAIERQIKALQGDIAAAEQRLPRAAEKAQMREMIERLAREIPAEVGVVQFTSMKIAEEGEKTAAKGSKKSAVEYRTDTYQTEVQADMNGIIKYVESIEKNPRFMSVNSLSLKPGKVTFDASTGKPVLGLHTVRLDIVTYVYTPGKG